MNDKETAKREDRADNTCTKVYTDGSGVGGQIGAAAVLYRDGMMVSSRRMRLGSLRHHTVFEGEGVGLILGVELVREEEEAEGMVTMGIDNIAAITATHTIKPSPSHHIWDTFHRRVEMLYNKHKGVDLLVKWVPSHMGILGNEKADEEAKKAALEGSSPINKLPAPLRKTLPRSKSVTHQEFMHKLRNTAEQLWKKLPRYKKLAHIDPTLKLNS